MSFSFFPLSFPTTLNCFSSCSTTPSLLLSFFFLICFFSSFFFMFFHRCLHSSSTHDALGEAGFQGVGVDRFSSRGSRGQGQHLQIAEQKAETAWPWVRTVCAAGIVRPCRVTTLSCKQRKKTEKSLKTGHVLRISLFSHVCVFIGIMFLLLNQKIQNLAESLWGKSVAILLFFFFF